MVDCLLVLEGVRMDIHIINGGRSIEVQINNFGLVFVSNLVVLVRSILHGALMLFSLVRF